MITAERQPINRQAAAQLSKGLNRVKTVEEAMKIVWAFLQQDEGGKRVREALERGVEVVEYRLKIYKRPSGNPGFTVRAYYHESTHDRNPIHFVDLL